MNSSKDSRPFDAICVGILVADIFSPPLAEPPAPGELVVVDDLPLDAGGCAVNTGVSLTKLGARVALVGKVGNDLFGDFIVDLMGQRGLDASGILRSQASPTSKTIVIPVVGQDRRFIHTFGANAELTAADLDRGLVARGKVLYVGGYLGLPRLDQEGLADTLAFAKAQGAKTILDVIVPSTASYGVDDVLARVLPHTDVFLPNDDEATLLTGETDPEKQAAAFLARGCGTAVITMGERGVLAKTATQTVRAPAFAVDAVDPSGAGDAFAAGFIIGLLEGWDLPRTVQFACAVGASATTKLGCTPGVFSMPEALAFLGENELAVRVDEAGGSG
ncbi:MAG TPA: sugar kinase [Anaerolineae bacterium]|nr:sugar kinase [Anaerolineae bacterium]